jgi:succinylglutamate desuccinylase
VGKTYYKKTNIFRFAKDFLDFEFLPTGQPFAWDGNTTYIAKPGECIVFPRPNSAVGEPAFILGNEVQYKEI